jgi:hypothetical protein
MPNTNRDYWEYYLPLLKKIKPKKIVEWGPGMGTDTDFIESGEPGNTKLAIDNTEAEIACIEHCPKWLPPKSERITPFHIRNENSAEYTSIPKGWENADIFFVDARNRVRCLNSIFKDATKKTAVVCIHDAERPRYSPGINQFKYVLYPHPRKRFCVMTNSKQKYNQIKKLYS